jgi:hypothetical protein
MAWRFWTTSTCGSGTENLEKWILNTTNLCKNYNLIWLFWDWQNSANCPQETVVKIAQLPVTIFWWYYRPFPQSWNKTVRQFVHDIGVSKSSVHILSLYTNWKRSYSFSTKKLYFNLVFYYFIFESTFLWASDMYSYMCNNLCNGEIYTPPSGAEVKKGLSYTSTHPMGPPGPVKGFPLP